MSNIPPPPDGPSPYPSSQTGLSRTVKIVLGAVIGAVALPFVMFLGVLVGSRVDIFAFVWLAPVLVLLAGVALLVDRETRPWGTGVLIGFFAMLIIGAGACALLIVGLSGSIG